MISEVIELKQDRGTGPQLKLVGNATVLIVIFLAISLLGLPAWCAAWLWASLDIGSLLHLKVTSSELFTLFYCASVGSALPPVAILLALTWMTKRTDHMAAILTMSEVGIGWKPINLPILLLLKLGGQNTDLVPWRNIIAVTGGETVKKLRTEYAVSVDESLYSSEPLSNNNEHAMLGKNGYINIIAKNKNDRLRCEISVFPKSMTDDARRELVAGIQRWAPECIITKSAVGALSGAQLEQQREVCFTSLWLELMDASRPRLRCRDLVPSDLLNSGRYVVVEKLATGGEANVYLAEDAELNNRKVVLKEYILSLGAGSQGALNSLGECENESSIMATLSSPLFCALLDVFVDDGRAYLVLEYVDGKSLRAIVTEEGSLSAPRAVAIAEQLAAALSILHGFAPPIIHRDITPDNILITADDKVKLIDFSVAIRGENALPGSAVGKVAYMSPDQFRGLVKRENDLYSFGATLFFLITGHDPEPISELHLPDSNCQSDIRLSEIVAKCSPVANSERVRYTNIEEVTSDLEQLSSLTFLKA